MFVIALISAFAFWGVSEGAPADVLLTINYNTSTAGRNSSQTFYVTLSDLSNILKNISDAANNLTDPQEKADIMEVVMKLEETIPKLVKNFRDPAAIKMFNDEFLNLLQNLYASDDEQIRDLLLTLLQKFTTKPVPKPTTPDLSKVKPLLKNLTALTTVLTELVSSGDSIISTIAQTILTDIANLPQSSDPWPKLIEIINLALLMLQFAGSDESAQKVGMDILTAVLGILPALPATVSGSSDGLAALLVTLITQLAERKAIKPDVASSALNTLSGPGRNTLANLIKALNDIIAALSKGLPDPFKPLFQTLMKQLTQFGSGVNNVPAILDTLTKLVDAVRGYTGTDKNSIVALLAIILNALKPLLGNVKATNDALQKLIDQLNLPAAPAAPNRSTCSGLIPSLLCTVNNVVDNLLGTSATGGGGLGGLLDNLLGSIG